MLRQVKIAVLQMDARVAETEERLNRAGKLVASAASTGAQLVILPELFNTGYTYSEVNYEKAETLNEATAQWLCQTAKEHQIYLIGSLMLRDIDHVYNSALMFSPEGQMWRYDKQFPFLWERAFFREGQGITIADTQLGRFGILICWDSAHPELWERYAGNVDAMLIVSCPPMVNKAQLAFPNGTRADFHSQGSHFADGGIHQQAAWMGVPVVHSSGSGKFRSSLPVPSTTAAYTLLSTPDKFIENVLSAQGLMIEADFGYHTQIIDAEGNVVARVTQDGDAFTVAVLDLADMPPLPKGEQPLFDSPPQEYFMIDVLSDMIYSPVYRRGLRRQWGARMAPLDEQTRIWSVTVIFSLVIGFILGLFSSKRD